MSYDIRILRLVTILRKLDDEGEVRTADLAAEFRVSQRSVQRDIEVLSKAGFPLVSPDKGIHTFTEGFSLKKMHMTPEEASLLSFFHEVAASFGSAFDKTYSVIFKKVVQQVYDTPYYAKIPEGVKLDKKIPFIKELENAIEEWYMVNLVYERPDGKEKRLRLCPLKIAFYEGFWYLIALVAGKDWVLKLRIERIKELDVLEKTFDPPANLKTMLDESVNVWFPEKRDKAVTLKIDKDVSRFFKQKKYFPLQKIKKAHADGSLVIECKTGNFMEIIPTIFHWIPYISVLSPQELKAEVKKTVDGYAGRL